MKKLSITCLALTALMLASCGGKGDSTESGNNTGSQYDLDTTITVNFYADYNQIIGNNVFATQSVKNGEKISKPSDPTAPFPEFPVFKGWSQYEIIDDTSKLWNFDTDVVLTNMTTFSIFGIWVAEGE